MEILNIAAGLGMTQTINSTELISQTTTTLERVHSGQALIVEHDGQDQAILINPIDYRILLAMLAHHTSPQQKPNAQNGAESFAPFAGLHERELTDLTIQGRWNRVMAAYLHEEISLGRAANLLDVPRLLLDERFQRLQIPRRIGPANLDELQSEIDVALRTRKKVDQIEAS